MPKVSTREKMILGLAAAAVISGAYTLISSPAKGSKPAAADARMTAVKDFMAGLGKLLKDQSPPEKIVYAIHAAETDWGGDPFSETLAEAAASPAAIPPNVISAEVFDYSGHLEMGNRRLAVIDGIEYEAGDLLEGDWYKVKKISPYQVIVESIPDGKETVINLHGIRENSEDDNDATARILPADPALSASFRRGAHQGNVFHEASPSPKPLNISGNGAKTELRRLP